MPPFGGAFAQQRPILSPIGQLLPVEGACVTGFPFCCINRAKHSAELATSGGPPYPAAPDFPPEGKRLTTFCASLSLLQNVFAVHPRESVSHDSQVALLPYSTAITDSQYFARHCVPSKYVRWCDSCSLATPSGGQNKPLCAPLQSHVAQPPKGVLLFHRTKGAAPWFFQLPATRPSRFQPLRPADWYLPTNASPSTLTEILRCRSG